VVVVIVVLRVVGAHAQILLCGAAGHPVDALHEGNLFAGAVRWQRLARTSSRLSTTAVTVVTVVSIVSIVVVAISQRVAQRTGLVASLEQPPVAVRQHKDLVHGVWNAVKLCRRPLCAVAPSSSASATAAAAAAAAPATSCELPFTSSTTTAAAASFGVAVAALASAAAATALPQLPVRIR
jgi:hypothetical protein